MVMRMVMGVVNVELMVEMVMLKGTIPNQSKPIVPTPSLSLL